MDHNRPYSDFPRLADHGPNAGHGLNLHVRQSNNGTTVRQSNMAFLGADFPWHRWVLQSQEWSQECRRPVPLWRSNLWKCHNLPTSENPTGKDTFLVSPHIFCSYVSINMTFQGDNGQHFTSILTYSNHFKIIVSTTRKSTNAEHITNHHRAYPVPSSPCDPLTTWKLWILCVAPRDLTATCSTGFPQCCPSKPVQLLICVWRSFLFYSLLLPHLVGFWVWKSQPIPCSISPSKPVPDRPVRLVSHRVAGSSSAGPRPTTENPTT